ncbi:hypothetical protein F2Q68_00004729 [Brassica cretica]|uniref:Uncharacterized protein n=1 Tax=Brassica cretica TaxID=69181 RepID=A0A8S9J8G3_BRACR|nr:hypothetical protein F2Q68_00004729 [Brassica cretica]
MLESCLLASSKKVDMCISLTGPPPSWSCCTRIDSHRLVHSHQKADHMDPERMFKPKANEAIPMAPFSKRHSHLPDDDDGPCSVIRGEELMEIRRKYSISPSVELRLQRRQLTPLTWRELIAIQVLGEFHGILFGTSEILYSYYFAPLIGKKGFYHIRSGDGNPLSFWLSSVLAFAVYRHVSFAGEASVRLAMEIPKRFRRDEYHKAKTWKRHPYSPLMPRFDFAVSPTGSSSSLPTTVSEWLEKKFDHWNPEEEYR